jgi:hypothetical protein
MPTAEFTFLKNGSKESNKVRKPILAVRFGEENGPPDHLNIACITSFWCRCLALDGTKGREYD